MDSLTARLGKSSVACVPLAEALTLDAAAWDRLVARSPGVSPFAGWAWHRAWASTAPGEELEASHALLLRNGAGVVDAVLPVGVREILFRRQRVKALTWAIGDVGCPDHLDVPALPEADLEAMVPALWALRWDVLILSNLAADAPNARRLAAALAESGAAVRSAAVSDCPHLELPASWEEYLASLSANRRHRLRREERHLQRDHAVIVTDYDGDRVEEGWRRLVALHEQRWEGAGAFRDRRVEELHRCFAQELSRRGTLWLTTLDVDGQPAAAWYGFADQDTVYFYQSGRDPRRDHESVGLVLMAMMIRRAIERGFRWFDFLRGDEAYKKDWTKARRVTSELVAFRPTWRGQWLRGLDLAGRLRVRLLARPPREPARSDAVGA